jgi:hypothetical protein
MSHLVQSINGVNVTSLSQVCFAALTNKQATEDFHTMKIWNSATDGAWFLYVVLSGTKRDFLPNFKKGRLLPSHGGSIVQRIIATIPDCNDQTNLCSAFLSDEILDISNSFIRELLCPTFYGEFTTFGFYPIVE